MTRNSTRCVCVSVHVAVVLSETGLLMVPCGASCCPFSCVLQREEEDKANIGGLDTEIQQKEELLVQLKTNVTQYQGLMEEHGQLLQELDSLEVRVCSKCTIVGN